MLNFSQARVHSHASTAARDQNTRGFQGVPVPAEFSRALGEVLGHGIAVLITDLNASRRNHDTSALRRITYFYRHPVPLSDLAQPAQPCALIAD